MSSKRKIIVSVITMVFVLISVIATVAVVYALTQQTIKTTLNIGYTVEDIDGTASATYTFGGVEEPLLAMRNCEYIGEELVFKAGDTEDAGNLVFPDDALALSSVNDSVVVKYTYSNTGEKHYIASMSFDAELISNNMNVEYGIWDSVNNEIKYSTDRYAVVVPANTTNKSYWIKISIADKAKSASFSGTFSWLLSGCDPQDKAYLSLPKVEFQGSAGSYSASIASNSEYVGNLVFPREVNGNPVTTIVQNSSLTQAQKNQVTSVYIPDSVTKIGANSFKGYENLQSITFEQNEVAGASAQSTTGLKTIENSAFKDCSLRSLVLPKTVTTIEHWAFSGCKFNSVDLPEGLLSIGSAVFGYNDNLTELTIPASVTTTFATPILGCGNVRKLTVANGNSVLHSSGNCLIKTSSKILFAGCPTSVIPTDGSVTTIMDSSFYKCTGLTSINIPDSVTTIEQYAFADCVNLKSLVIGSGLVTAKAQNGGNESFVGCRNLKNITINNNNDIVIRIVKELCSWSGDVCLKIDTVTSISPGQFENFKGLTSVVISDTVTSLGQAAFICCSDLKHVKIGNGVTSIANMAFNQTPLESIEIGSSVSSSDPTAYPYPNTLKTINVNPNNTKYHSSGNCLIETASKTLILGSNTSVIPTDGSVTIIGSCAFAGCRGLTEIVIPNTITQICELAFESCTGLTEVVIPDSVTTFGVSNDYSWVFGNCTNLQSLTLGLNVPSYSNSSNFYNCTGLKTIVVKGELALQSCLFYSTGATGVHMIIADNVTSIGEWCFWPGDCVTKLTIGSGVTSIGINNFAVDGCCNNLTEVIFKDTTTWTAGSTVLTEAQLSDPATAVSLLKTTYGNVVWTKN